MNLSQRLAVTSARHLRRTLGAWIAVCVLAVVAIGGLLGGALTTEGKPTNNPQSERALDALRPAFPGPVVTDRRGPAEV